MRYFSYTLTELDQVPVLREMCAAEGMICGVSADRDVMNWKELRQIASDPLCTIGAHTVHHYNLKRLTAGMVSQEMRLSADMLEDKLGNAPSFRLSLWLGQGRRKTRSRDRGRGRVPLRRHHASRHHSSGAPRQSARAAAHLHQWPVSEARLCADDDERCDDAHCQCRPPRRAGLVFLRNSA